MSDPRFGVVEAWRAPAQATAIGVRWERIGFWWKEMQPSGPESWNDFATGQDHFITRDLAAGRRLAGLLINTPDWAAVDPGVHGASVPKGLYLPYNDPVRPYPKAGFFATLDDQASYIVQAFAIDLAMGVERIEVNRMVDGTDFIAGGEPFGLLRNDGSARPAYYAFRTVSTLFAGVTGGTIAVDQASGVFTITLRKPGATVTVVWDQSPLGATVSIPALGTRGTIFDKLGNKQAGRPSGGHYTFSLTPATGNTNANDPHDYVMGGSPVILVQKAVF